MQSNDVRDPQTYSIIGAGMEVYNELGCGFLENAYHEAMKEELGLRGISVRPEVSIPIYYKGKCLDCKYRADLICFDDVIVEIKAIKQLTSLERAQVINYLKATGYRVAILLNFGAESLQYERIVLSGHPKSQSPESA
jgi:GxxExxY protein